MLLSSTISNVHNSLNTENVQHYYALSLTCNSLAWIQVKKWLHAMGHYNSKEIINCIIMYVIKSIIVYFVLKMSLNSCCIFNILCVMYYTLTCSTRLIESMEYFDVPTSQRIKIQLSLSLYTMPKKLFMDVAMEFGVTLNIMMTFDHPLDFVNCFFNGWFTKNKNSWSLRCTITGITENEDLLHASVSIYILYFMISV